MHARAFTSIWDHVHYDGPGNGTAGSPFTINSAQQLNTVLRNNASTQNRHFVLTNHINMRDLAANNNVANWTTIPTLAIGSVFNGNNYSINNLYYMID